MHDGVSDDAYVCNHPRFDPLLVTHQLLSPRLIICTYRDDMNTLFLAVLELTLEATYYYLGFFFWGGGGGGGCISWTLEYFL